VLRLRLIRQTSDGAIYALSQPAAWSSVSSSRGWPTRSVMGAALRSLIATIA